MKDTSEGHRPHKLSYRPSLKGRLDLLQPHSNLQYGDHNGADVMANDEHLVPVSTPATEAN
jgi:hypothetical protein